MTPKTNVPGHSGQEKAEILSPREARQGRGPRSLLAVLVVSLALAVAVGAVLITAF